MTELNSDENITDIKSVNGGSRRRASKQVRREQLINATIDILEKRGFAATTLSDVTERAGLSRGIVNFHFESKERLFLETLQFMSDTHCAHWQNALDKAGDQPGKKMRALIVADLDKKVCNKRLVTAWVAFWAEAKSRPAFKKLCWLKDDKYLAELKSLCSNFKKEGDYRFDVQNTAVAIYAMQEGLWLRLMLGGKDFKREMALEVALETLGSLFPKHFKHDGTPRVV